MHLYLFIKLQLFHLEDDLKGLKLRSVSLLNLPLLVRTYWFALSFYFTCWIYGYHVCDNSIQYNFSFLYYFDKKLYNKPVHVFELILKDFSILWIFNNSIWKLHTSIVSMKIKKNFGHGVNIHDLHSFLNALNKKQS